MLFVTFKKKKTVGQIEVTTCNHGYTSIKRVYYIILFHNNLQFNYEFISKIAYEVLRVVANFHIGIPQK